jgi:protein tyrosine phosphatase
MDNNDNSSNDDESKYSSSFWRTYPLYWVYGKLRSKIQPYIDDSFEATQIIKGLWVGGICSPSNAKNMKSHNIKMVVSTHVGASPLYPYQFEYRLIELLDIPNENIIHAFDKIIPDIHDVIVNQEKSVLVHCIAGASRSVTIVAAYLMRYHNMDVNSALSHMKRLREEVDPNEGYIDQLRIYYRHLQVEKQREEQLRKNSQVDRDEIF